MAGAARAEKTIRVCVVEFDGYNTTNGEWREKQVNGTQTVQAAVEECTGFPRRCLRVRVRRDGEFVAGDLWTKGDPDVVWRRELYDAIADGDEVVIVVSAYMPGGPRKAEEGVEARGGGQGAEGIRADGPQAARLAGLLRQLRLLGVGSGRDESISAHKMRGEL